jgi:hypothetical protein
MNEDEVVSIGPVLSEEEQAIATKRELVVELDAKCHEHEKIMVPTTQDEVMIKFGTSYFMLKSNRGPHSTYVSGILRALSNLTNVEFSEINISRGYGYPSDSIKCFCKNNDDPEITLFNSGNITELKTKVISNQIRSDFLDRRIEVGRLDDMIKDKE